MLLSHLSIIDISFIRSSSSSSRYSFPCRYYFVSVTVFMCTFVYSFWCFARWYVARKQDVLYPPEKGSRLDQLDIIDIEQNHATINTGEGTTKIVTHYQQQGSSAEELLIRRVSSSQASIPHSNPNSTSNPTTIQTMPRPVLFRDIVLTQLHMIDEGRKQTKQEYPNAAHN